ncbi:MAG: bifunctional methionine sulfoxide reductase B/A protein [Phaeodactylibacter sp.]|nr:bifunctional methionine sulfoxide reductase B/A protein [Phaeodactylibacter sp.]MCB9274973.1 bifunctional methionine sulfoxide reductase B/A protein [Lewinellaceae bacterium]
MKTKHIALFPLLLAFFLLPACAQQSSKENLTEFPPVITDPAHYNELTPKEERVILHKGTEMAFSGAFHNYKESGTYICKQCNQPLFRSDDKFNSGTGWPSFDDFIPGAVKEIPDADGQRTEIVCSNCGAHLGHVFFGEGFTKKQARHCVNSVSLDFVPLFNDAEKAQHPDNGIQPLSEYIKGKGYEKYEQATFAGGCFWCTEASFDLLQGAVDVISGYSGGKKDYPTYEEVSSGTTGHAESVAIFYDPAVISYETLLHAFFIAHDPTQLNRQGPDVGTQYRSAIFYHNDAQKASAEAYIKELEQSGKYDKPIVTEVAPYTNFWVAEDYHQDYFPNHPENPYVQRISKPKVEKVKKAFPDILKDGHGQ